MFLRKLVRKRTVQNIETYRKTLGHRIRDGIANIGHKLHPIASLICPNFIAFHYFYIIGFSILGSIIMYPVKNYPYIDILFLATGAATQGGLNTVSINDLLLYQQIVVYVVTTLTSSIFIHSGLAFVRLYWFERYFDGIRDWSKKDFEMRRTMTLRNREMSRNYTSESASRSATLIPSSRTKSFSRAERDSRNFQVKLFSGEMVNRDEDNNDESSLDNRNNVESSNKSEKFLSRRKSRDINPADMYRSIAMLQDRHENKDNTTGPALVVKSPAERDIEMDQEQGASQPTDQHGQSIQFKVEPRPVKPMKHHSESSGLRKSFTQRKRPSFFKGSQSARSIRNKLRRKSKGLEYHNIDDEDGHDADMEGSSDDDEEAIQSSNSFSSSVPDSASAHNYATDDFTEHGSNVEMNSEPSSLDSHNISEYDDDDEGDHNSNAPDNLSYYGMQDGPSLRNRLNRVMSSNYLSYQPAIGRNSTFVGLSDSQKVELGGVEYRATKILCLILTIYFVGFHIMALIGLLGWIQPMDKYKKIIRADGINPTWWAFFTSMSSFNDLGLTLTPDSMYSFNKSIFVLLWMSWFIVVGNTGFPILLRFIIWILFKISPDLSLRRDSLGFLLDHPRRCFTMLFPKAATWWLLLILVGLNAIDLILFIVLDLDTSVVKSLSAGFKVLNGLFQAVNTRTAGFSVLDLSQLHPSVQVSYMLMMYISVLPIAISIRRTNVYEEQSLGIYPNENAEPDDNNTKSFIGAHLRRQLSFDLWYMFLGLFVICICEGGKLQDASKPQFNVFQVLFEIVSAYGTVGLSLGYPGTNTSFSAQFTTISKLVIIAMLIRGRHRGLPYTLDRAIILPSEKLQENDMLHEMSQNRRSPSGLCASTSYDNRASYVGDASSEGSHERFGGFKRQSRSIWHGIASAFSMGHQPRLNRSLTSRSLDGRTMTLSHSDMWGQNEASHRYPNNSFPMERMNSRETFPRTLSSPPANLSFRDRLNDSSESPLGGIHANTVEAFENSNSNINSTNSKHTESSSSDPIIGTT